MRPTRLGNAGGRFTSNLPFGLISPLAGVKEGGTTARNPSRRPDTLASLPGSTSECAGSDQALQRRSPCPAPNARNMPLEALWLRDARYMLGTNKMAAGLRGPAGASAALLYGVLRR